MTEDSPRSRLGSRVVAEIVETLGRTDRSLRSLLTSRRSIPLDRLRNPLGNLQIGDPPAKVLYNQILAMAAEFETSVPADLSMVGVFAMPGGEEIYITAIAYVEPNMLSLSGTNEAGFPVRVLVCAGSMTLMFRTFPKSLEDCVGRRIGFREVRDAARGDSGGR